MPQASSTVTVARGNPPSRLDMRFARNAALLVASLAVLLQLAIFFSADNLVASALVLSGLFMGLFYSLDRQLLTECPLSTLAILGYTISYFIIPPLGQLADFHSILHNLHHHILVWVYGVAGLVAIIVAHYLYRVFSLCDIARRFIAGFFYRPLRFFEMPNALQFWLMGFIGVVATIVNVRIVNGTEDTTTLSSVMRVFEPLIYTPYFLAFPNLIDPRYRPKPRPLRLGFIAYSILVIAVAAMVNSRGFMFTGFASLAVAYAYRVLTGTIAPPRLTWRATIILVVGFWLVSGPFLNMAASMVIARKLRSTVSPRELAVETWDVYRSGIAVRSVERAENGKFTQYDETYYNNIFLDRIGNVRFTDISVDAVNGAENVGELPYFREIQIDKVIAILPEPVLKALHIGVDKRKVLGGSSEDFLYQLATGYPVGGFKTGSPLVILIATFGTLWPLYFVVLVIVLFIFIDARADLISVFDEGGNRLASCSVFNPIVAGTLFGYAAVFTVFGAQDLASYISILTRQAVELALVYGLTFMVTKGASSLMLGWMWRAGNASQRGA